MISFYVLFFAIEKQFDTGPNSLGFLLLHTYQSSEINKYTCIYEK